jgi:hypothetical protein
MPQGVPGIADRCLIFIVEAGGQVGMAHVQDLLQVGHLPEAFDTLAVDVQVEVYEIKGLEDIADAAAAVEVKSAIEHDILYLEGLGGRDQANHAIGDGDPIIIGGVDGVSADDPGGGLGRGL